MEQVTQTPYQNQDNTPFMIYRDGELDRVDYYQKRISHFLHAVGHVAYKGAELIADRLDEALADAGAYEGITLTNR